MQFGQGRVGTVHLCCTRFQLKQLKGQGWNHPKVCSLMCLEGDALCRLSLQLEVFTWLHGCFTAWRLGPKRTRWKI